MAEKKAPQIDGAELRRGAEERLRENRGTASSPGISDEQLKLLHELQVHQVELEMQNEELRQAREDEAVALGMYTDLYEVAPVGYFTIDRGGIIRRVNLTGASLLGIERSRLTGRRFSLSVAIESRLTFAEFLDKVFSSQGKEGCELALMKEDKSPLSAQIEAVAAAAGEECRVAVIDITERKRAEDALSEKRRELEESNFSLVQALDDLQRKEHLLIIQGRHAAMGEMISNIAHQWRQPLNALGLLVQQVPLLYGSAEFNKEFLEENSGKAMQVIHHMSRTINDFKNFFRSDKEKIPFSINKVLRQTTLLIEENFIAQQISISFHTEGDPMIIGYPNEYAQALLNILMNARDALVERNVDDPRILLHTFVEGDKAVATITDNAGGIAEEVMDKVFDPYFTTKEPDKGTGIGLFMSKIIIEKNMGGRLMVHNTGQGAEFRIEV